MRTWGIKLTIALTMATASIWLLPFWLVSGVILLSIIIVLGNYTIIQYFKTLRLLQYLWFVTASIAVVVFIRTFLFEVYSIKSGSMERALYKDDIILVNKLSYGPILPRSFMELPLFEIINTFFPELRSDEIAVQKAKGGLRLSGLRKIERGAVIIFKMPTHNVDLVKRCIGLPGDSINIVNGQVLINGHYAMETNTVTNNYTVFTNNRKHLQRALDSLGLNSDIIETGTNYVTIMVTSREYNFFKNSTFVDSIVVSSNDHSEILLALDTGSTKPANCSNIILPYKGLELKLTPDFFSSYGDLARAEGASITLSNERYFVDGSVSQTYKFRRDYFFVMGDNRSHSIDSRMFGPIPIDMIVGRVGFTLYSSN